MLKQMVGRYFETKDPALRLSPTSLRELMVIDWITYKYDDCQMMIFLIPSLLLF